MIEFKKPNRAFIPSGSIFDLAEQKKHLEELEKAAEDESLWNDPQFASKLMKQIAELRQELDVWKKIDGSIRDALELTEMGDEAMRTDLEFEIGEMERFIEQKEIDTLLSGKFDRGDAILSIHAGAGGVDSQDWAAMLERMYLRWAEQKNYQAEILDVSEGEEAGIKSVTISISGKHAYGYLRTEKGTHRLVRLSPFDSAHRRHTSFAQVEVLPDVPDDDTIEIESDDIKIDVFRSSSAGGQNVQKNATAVRITHIPTGLVVTCQNERSQNQNRENGMRVLRARLFEMKQEEQERQLTKLRGDYVKAEFGSQIRSYVLHPYQMVKDHRTEHETGNIYAVLDGDLDGFIESYLRHR